MELIHVKQIINLKINLRQKKKNKVLGNKIMMINLFMCVFLLHFLVHASYFFKNFLFSSRNPDSDLIISNSSDLDSILTNQTTNSMINIDNSISKNVSLEINGTYAISNIMGIRLYYDYFH